MPTPTIWYRAKVALRLLPLVSRRERLAKLVFRTDKVEKPRFELGGPSESNTRSEHTPKPADDDGESLLSERLPLGEASPCYRLPILEGLLLPHTSKVST
jgi:hypothetical protein